MSNLGSKKIFVDKTQWNNRTSRQKGCSSEALAVNANLDAISASLHSLYTNLLFINRDTSSL